MKILRYILFPIMPFYYLATWLRNKLFDLGIKKSKSYSTPVICVGNLSVGGTGKTPMIEHLITVLKNEYKVATLSRGYKRKTKGFQLGDKNASAETIGDEPFQFYNKFKEDVLVAVDADRQNGIEQLMNLPNAPEVILLDDAYQHRKVEAGFNILLTTYANPYFKDYVLPTGNLREPRSGANRANIIVVTKCPDNLNETDKTLVLKRINADENQHVFFSNIAYAETLLSAEKTMKVEDLTSFCLVTGIANSKPLTDFLETKKLKFDHLNFNDHHNFSPADIAELSKKELIVTTEKDFMRLKDYEVLKDKLFYLPIAIAVDKEPEFRDTIKAYLTA
ncbi:tetraacyldisaccharide 4'-kinase [Algibacter lectus]|uniref:Tetraacyldisaccharide 4'-kinase n=1 Tax=Algibacter lectus TaxID=221126 RepID=A0A4R8M888_9FLAO|nr:tetraacyldisaccharide 4'-kinase [Algibacter lectus]MWW26490.1 tetraacyldisaccharide 4'-kinase [Algibacter lectus]TDY59816.1 lipid-A-disaccharide kinase [Algibacter lectus]